MKPRIVHFPLLVATSIILTGCSTLHRTTAKAAPKQPHPASVEILAPPTIAAESVRVGSLTKAYYFGRIVDEDDDSLMYEAGTVYRTERPERWNRNPTRPTAFFAGPAVRYTSAAAAPGPLPADVQQAIARQTAVMASLGAQNEALVKRVRELQSAPAPAPAGNALPPVSAAGEPNHTSGTVEKVPVRPPPNSAPAVAATDPDWNIVTPNAENAIELDPRLFDSGLPADSNPFVQIYQPRVSFRDVSLVVSAVILGPSPSAILNGRIYTLGDSFEGMTLHRMDPDGIFLRKDTFLLRCPVGEAPIKLRLPQ